MLKRASFAALAVSLVLATPATAQSSSFGPTAEPPPTARLFNGTRTGVSVGRAYGVEADGTVDSRRRIVGQVGVADNFEMGIGLFSIIRDSRERRIGRADPMRDTGARSRTVVAAGMTLRF